MKPAVLACSVLATVTAAINLSERTASPRVVSLDTERNTIADPLARDQLRRRGIISETLDNEGDLYFANLTMGTPAQALRLHIDTGSSDLWVNIANSTYCETSQSACDGGFYNPSTSTTYRYVNGDFNISYVDGSASSGDYAEDSLSIGGQTLQNFQFGIGFVSSSQEGVLGIGYPIHEVQVNRAGGNQYPNLPQALKNAGLINTNAYSLWLNDLDASTGTIIFGGVNTGSYVGDLVTIPILQEYGLYQEFVVALTGIAIAGSDLSSSASMPIAVLLDSGTTLTYLPNDLANAVYNQVNAVVPPNSQVGYVNCNLASQNSNVDFTFSGQTISVPYNELILGQAIDAMNQPLTLQNGDPACAFGIAPAGDSSAVLGDTFLRSAYVVFDLDNNEISIAQTNFNATISDVREITAGSNGVPGATTVASAGTATATVGDPRLGGPSSTITTPPSGLSNGVCSISVQRYGGIFATIAALFSML